MFSSKLKCFVVISGVAGWGQKCSKASGRAPCSHSNTCSHASPGLREREAAGEEEILLPFDGKSEKRFCFLLMGRARSKHLDAVKKKPKPSSAVFVMLSGLRVQNVWISVHALSLHLRKVYEPHEAPR